MITTGIISINKIMWANPSLLKLYIGGGNIGDGILTIAGAFGNCKSGKLFVDQCGVTLTEAKSLAMAISFNHTISELALFDNPIILEGTRLIVNFVVHNTMCQYVGSDNKYKNYEIWKMINILEDTRGKDPLSSDLCDKAHHKVLTIWQLAFLT